jgi:hypothetical protein
MANPIRQQRLGQLRIEEGKSLPLVDQLNMREQQRIAR